MAFPDDPTSQATPARAFAPVPIPIKIGQDAIVFIGNFALPYGPRTVTETTQVNVVRQVTINSIFLWDYGVMPTRYTIKGTPNQGDVAQIQDILGQFPNPLSFQALLIPNAGVHDTVRLLSWEILTDAQANWSDPEYTLEFESVALLAQPQP